MHEFLHEQVDVLAVFAKNKLEPRILKWGNRKYKIERITMNYEQFDGRETVHYFSVTDNANYFKLAFYTRSLKWYLEEIYNEA